MSGKLVIKKPRSFFLFHRAILLALAVATLPEPAVAQTITSIDTELVKGRCRFIADDGEVGHYALKRCPGLAGARVYTEAGVNVGQAVVPLGQAQGRGGQQRQRRRQAGMARDQDPSGLQAARGASSTIVVKDYPAEKRHNVLGVLRMEPRNACLMAVVDEAANSDALALARKTADTEAPSFSCANGKAKVVGAATKWTREAIGYDGDPPK